MLIGAAVVPHLIHDAEGVAAVGIHRLVQAHRVAEGIHGEHHLLPGDGEVLGDLLHGGLALGLGQQRLAGAEDLVGRVAHTAADTEGAVVTEVAANLADDHGHAVGGEADGLGDIEIVDGLHEADAAHLKEIVGTLAPACEALDDGQHQAEVAADELLAGVLIAVLGTAEKGHHFIVFQNGQLRRVDAAYLHPAAHNATCLLC